MAAGSQIVIQIHFNLHDAALRYFYQRLGAGWVIDKTCINVMRVPYLHKLFPRARFVFIHRDGRDNISSCAMNAPIDTATTRVGPPITVSMIPAVSATICSVVNPDASSVAPTPRLSKVTQR